ncbi:MAG: hypothetical protein Kow0077_31300 [Anaerolineae bacterium]
MLRPNIALLTEKGDIAGLVEALDDESPWIRKQAATALQQLNAQQAVPALEAALIGETNWQVVASISMALNRLRQVDRLAQLVAARDVPGLIDMLASPLESDVIRAAHALGQLGAWQAVLPLINLFTDTTNLDTVRFAAAEALLALNSAPAEVTLLAALRHEDWQIRRNAAAILGQLQATWAVPGLVAALDDVHPAVVQVAQAALQRINTPAAQVALTARRAGASQDAQALA